LGFGRQLLFEAFAINLSPDSTPDNTGMRVTVKNTFIECRGSDEEEEVHHSGSLHDRGAQTCTARFSSPTPSSMIPGEGMPEDAWNALATEEAGQPLDGLEEGEEADRSPAKDARAEVAEIATPSPQRPPGAFQAPSAATPRTAADAAGAAAGLQMLQFALGLSIQHHPELHIDDSDEDEDVHVRVKNTFIELEPDQPVHMRGTRSCTARLAAVQPQLLFPSTTPKGGRTMSVMATLPGQTVVVQGTVAPTIRVTPAPLVVHQVQTVPQVFFAAPTAGSQTSPGSSLHGQVDADGHPLCQPCAWFYKGDGCQNGATCRRCHLCPEGELKLRKKHKISKMRSQETPASGASVSPSASPRPSPVSSGYLTGSPSHAGASPSHAGASPMSVTSLASSRGPTTSASHITPSNQRWADVEEEDEEGRQPPQQASVVYRHPHVHGQALRVPLVATSQRYFVQPVPSAPNATRRGP